MSPASRPWAAVAVLDDLKRHGERGTGLVDDGPLVRSIGIGGAKRTAFHRQAGDAPPQLGFAAPVRRQAGRGFAIRAALEFEVQVDFDGGIRPASDSKSVLQFQRVFLPVPIFLRYSPSIAYESEKFRLPFSFYTATLAAMSTFHPPRQARARATLERIFEATVELLEDRPFEALSVADIVARANTSVGAFYKRFSSKEALLPVLLDWIHRQQFEAIEAFIGDPRWQGVGLAARIEEFVDSLVQSYCRHRFLMRALVARQYSADNQQSAEQTDSAERTLRYYIDWLLACRDEIRHPDPEVAVAIGLTGLVTQAQTRLLFGARSVEMADETFTEELKRAFLAYLRDPNHAPA